MSNFKLIPLVGKHGAGKFAIVDAADYDDLAQHRWYFNAGYAVRALKASLGERPPNTRRKKITMCNYLTQCPPGMQPDHVNRNPLDNRRFNLVIKTQTRNLRNRKSWGTSKYRGVQFDSKKGIWRAVINVQCSSEEEAAEIADRMALAAHGELPNPNLR